MMRGNGLIGLLLWAAAFAATCSAQQSCLKYGPAVVRLKGVIVRKTYPGPPNYKDTNKGDHPETYWLLDLSQPVCVEKDSDDPDLNPACKNVRTIQLVLPNSGYYREHNDLIGKKVLAIGTLFGQHTAHHHTPVLLTVSSIKRND